jgi:hypothetical protein
MAHTRPTVAPAEGLLTEAVLKPVCVLPNRRPFRVASRNSQDGSKNRGRAQQGNCGPGSRYRGRGGASDELSPIVRGARESPSPNRARAGGSGGDHGVGARHGRDADNVSNDWVRRTGRTATDVGRHGRSSLCTCHAKPKRFCGSWQVWRWQIGSCSVSTRHSGHAKSPHPSGAAPARRAGSRSAPSHR